MQDHLTANGIDATYTGNGVYWSNINGNNPSDAVKLSKGNTLVFNVAGEVSIVWYGGGNGAREDAEIYYDADGKCHIVMLKDAYLRSLTIDFTTKPTETQSWNVTFNNADGDTPTTSTVKLYAGNTYAIADPTFAGHTFTGWVDAKNSPVDLTQTISATLLGNDAAVTITATWSAGEKQYQTISSAMTFNWKAAKIQLAADDSEVANHVKSSQSDLEAAADTYFKLTNITSIPSDWLALGDNDKSITFKVAKGATVTIYSLYSSHAVKFSVNGVDNEVSKNALYKSNAYNAVFDWATLSGGDNTLNEVTIVITGTGSQSYIAGIEVEFPG